VSGTTLDVDCSHFAQRRRSVVKIRQLGRTRTTTKTTVVITTIINVLFEISKLLLSMKNCGIFYNNIHV
jgi:hypothetical protein